MRIDYETIEKWIGVSALLVFALFELVPSWRGAIRNIVAGLGFTLIAAGLPYLLSQPARTQRQRAALMFFGLGGGMFFLMVVGA